MATFTPLERKAIDAILAELPLDERAVVERQLRQAVVRSRENTGGGFYTDIEVGTATEKLDWKTPPFGQAVLISVDGLERGLGMILHQRKGRVHLLEGYAVDAEDTSAIDFEQVPFALVTEPGALPGGG